MYKSIFCLFIEFIYHFRVVSYRAFKSSIIFTGCQGGCKNRGRRWRWWTADHVSYLIITFVAIHALVVMTLNWRLEIIVKYSLIYFVTEYSCFCTIYFIYNVLSHYIFFAQFFSYAHAVSFNTWVEIYLNPPQNFEWNWTLL